MTSRSEAVSPQNLTARRTRRGWTWYCHDCQRGHMGAGPMQLHLRSNAHCMTLAQVHAALHVARRTEEVLMDERSVSRASRGAP